MKTISTKSLLIAAIAGLIAVAAFSQ